MTLWLKIVVLNIILQAAWGLVLVRIIWERWWRTNSFCVGQDFGCPRILLALLQTHLLGSLVSYFQALDVANHHFLWLRLFPLSINYKGSSRLYRQDYCYQFVVPLVHCCSVGILFPCQWGPCSDGHYQEASAILGMIYCVSLLGSWLIFRGPLTQYWHSCEVSCSSVSV